MDILREEQSTYKAYCIAPSFFSWLGKGTSRRGLPVTLNGGPCASCEGVTSVLADLVDVEEMNAEGPVRREGMRADVGLTGGMSIHGGNRGYRIAGTTSERQGGR